MIKINSCWGVNYLIYILLVWTWYAFINGDNLEILYVWMYDYWNCLIGISGDMNGYIKGNLRICLFAYHYWKSCIMGYEIRFNFGVLWSDGVDSGASR